MQWKGRRALLKLGRPKEAFAPATAAYNRNADRSDETALLHDQATAKSALADLEAATPGLTSVTAVRNWIHPQANLHGYEPLFDGPRLAGLPDHDPP